MESDLWEEKRRERERSEEQVQTGLFSSHPSLSLEEAIEALRSSARDTSTHSLALQQSPPFPLFPTPFICFRVSSSCNASGCPTLVSESPKYFGISLPQNFKPPKTTLRRRSARRRRSGRRTGRKPPGYGRIEVDSRHGNFRVRCQAGRRLRIGTRSFLACVFCLPVFSVSSRLLLMGTILQLSKRNHYVIQNHCASMSSSLPLYGGADKFLFALPSPYKRTCLFHSPAFIASDATRNHFDLRLQLDNETISWAIPKGLSDPAGQTIRYAIETVPHHLNYSLLEGSVVAGRSTTGCWDVGTYTVRLFPFFLPLFYI
jgi:hypothetical protein